jgi:hypothetical protein
MPNWLIVIITSLLSGLAGSIITTYGQGARERRKARADTREAIRNADRLAADPPNVPFQTFTAALDSLETAAVIARLPRALIRVHRDACERYWVLAQEQWHVAVGQLSPGSPLSGINYKGPRELECWQVAHQAADLLASATWHPWIGAPYRTYRARQLCRTLRSIPITESPAVKPDAEPMKGKALPSR